MTRNQIVEDARRWIGTPYRHQGRLLGVAGDCVAAVEWLALKYGIINEPHRANYGSEPKMREILKALTNAGCTRLRSTNDRLPGDIAFIKWYNEPQHLGIVAPDDRLIHGYSSAGAYVETRFNSRLLDGLCSIWVFPGVE